MGVVESIRGVLWARKRRPDTPAYLVALAHERFQPDELLAQAVDAEQAGFDGVCVMNVSGADPRGMLRAYGADVLPALRAD